MSDTTSMPVQSVDADQLPQQKGISYSEVAKIVGSLYLDSQMNLSTMNEQHSAVVSEYQRQLQEAQSAISQLQNDIGKLKDELERSK